MFISRMKDIQRVFQYHGAEHKAIYTHEAGLGLTAENDGIRIALVENPISYHLNDYSRGSSV